MNAAGLVADIRPRASYVCGLPIKEDGRHDGTASALTAKAQAKNASIEFLMALNVAPSTTSALVASLRP
ncbi:hypothetical protein [Caballeronia sp. S22]|uniref:hypothetical protein n=1 Tax=Caballeronia sp. S22 TaxID=3137182 RepID=UPI0035312A92